MNQLKEEFGDKLEVLAFPCNQFGHQENTTEAEMLYLKEALPIPFDDAESFMSDPKFILWSPVCRSDVAWNFEKFLVGRDGRPFRRYSRRFETKTIAEDITKLLVWPKTPVPVNSSAFRDLP